MARQALARVVVVVALVGILFGLAVWHGTLEPDPAAWALPGTEELASDYGGYVGERVALGGRIVGTDPVVISSPYGVDGTLRLRIVGLDDAVQAVVGANLRVYGVAGGDHTVRSLNAFVVPRSGVVYTYSISFVAGLWALGRVVRHWRIHRRTLALGRRDEPRRVGRWLRTRWGREAAEDA